jgi:hypothetical protein
MMAFRKDSFVSISCGVRWLAATDTAFAPVSSAIRRRVDETAGAEAPRSGMNPKAAVMHAMVLAVPITPQVPTSNNVNYFQSDLWRNYGSYCGRQLFIKITDIFHVD